MTFKLTMQLEHEQPLTSADPTIIDDKLLQATWNMLALFVEELLQEVGLEANETAERELVVELCYRLIFREMTTLRQLPVASHLMAKPKSRRRRRFSRVGFDVRGLEKRAEEVG